MNKASGELEESQGVQYDVPGLIFGLATQLAGFTLLAVLSHHLCRPEREAAQREESGGVWAWAAAGGIVGGATHVAACVGFGQERGVCEAGMWNGVPVVAGYALMASCVVVVSRRLKGPRRPLALEEVELEHVVAAGGLLLHLVSATAAARPLCQCEGFWCHWYALTRGGLQMMTVLLSNGLQVSLGGSSMVEEEHQTFYFLTATLCLCSARKALRGVADGGNGLTAWRPLAAVGVLMVCSRVGRSWNQVCVLTNSRRRGTSITVSCWSWNQVCALGMGGWMNGKTEGWVD